MTSQESFVRNYFILLTRAQYDQANNYVEKLRFTANFIWPKALWNILCEFVLSEKYYFNSNFEPSKAISIVGREDKNYLKIIYNTLCHDLEVLQTEVSNDFVIVLITSLLHYIPVRLKFLELYDKMHDIGSTDDFVDFSELTESVEEIQYDYSTLSTIGGLLKILRYEHNSLKHLFKCHEHLEKWLYIESLLSMKKGSDAILSWEANYLNRRGWFLNLFSRKTPLSPLLSWFKRFRHMTISKFTLYFYGVLIQQTSFQDVQSVCSSQNIHLFTRMQELQIKSDAQFVVLVFDASGIEDFRGPGFWCSSKEIVDPYIKYQIMLSYPKVPVKLDVLDKLMPGNDEEEESFSRIKLTVIDDAAYLLKSVDSRVSLIMFYGHKPKNEEREKALTYEFVSLLQCHRIFFDK